MAESLDRLGHTVQGFAIAEIYAAYSADDQALPTEALERPLQVIVVQSHSCHFLLRGHENPKHNSGIAV